MYQKIEIIGNLGKEPELRYTADGKATVSLSVATNRNTAQGQEETTWFRVIAWDKAAEYLSKYAQIGAKVFASGRLVIDPATHGPRVFVRQDGTATSSFEIVADTVKLISGYKNFNGQQSQQPRPQSQQTYNKQQTQAPVQQRTAQPQQQQAFNEDIPW